jgi:predicted nucleic acid-binding protein
MYKLLLDSDALIKLTKAGLLEDVCRHYNCIITTEVKNEAVDEGKRRLHQDALKIEYLINKKSLKIKDSKKSRKTKENLGKGEMSTASLYFEEKNRVIITDDSAFIKYLEENGMRFSIPADLVLLMKVENKIDRKTALIYLEKMRDFIKEEVYSDVKKDIMED